MAREITTTLVVVSVANVTAEGVQDVTDLKIRGKAVTAELSVEGDGGARALGVGTAADGGAARRVRVLPDAESVVDEQVVHEEDRVTNGRGHFSHDSANAVVAVTVGSRGQYVNIGRAAMEKRAKEKKGEHETYPSSKQSRNSS